MFKDDKKSESVWCLALNAWCGNSRMNDACSVSCSEAVNFLQLRLPYFCMNVLLWQILGCESLSNGAGSRYRGEKSKSILGDKLLQKNICFRLRLTTLVILAPGSWIIGEKLISAKPYNHEMILPVLKIQINITGCRFFCFKISLDIMFITNYLNISGTCLCFFIFFFNFMWRFSQLDATNNRYSKKLHSGYDFKCTFNGEIISRLMMIYYFLFLLPSHPVCKYIQIWCSGLLILTLPASLCAGCL